jgi:Galactose oxidase-like, Early set domain/Chitobiase/beta-hexosaminidase C-terminal domain/Glyoxal oxidase N-terminus
MRHCAPSSSPLSLSVHCFLCISVFVASALGQANVQGQWTTLPSTLPINPVHATLLANGKVLIVAGSGNCTPSLTGCPSGPPYGPSNGSGALLLDPVTGQTIRQFTLSWDMFCNAMVMLQDGRVLIDGGTIQYDPFYGAANASIFDPATNTFADIQPTLHGRWYPTLLTLGDGRVITFSGVLETGGTNKAIEFYTIGSGWTSPFDASWTPDLYPRLHLLSDGKVFYSGAQTKSKLFDPSTKTWNTNFATTNYGGLRTYGSSVLLPLSPADNYDSKVLIMGGGNPSTNTTEIIDLGSATPSWQYGPAMSQPRIEMNAVLLPNGKVLALGGSLFDEESSTASFNADLFDPATNTFSSAGVYAYARLYHSVALLLPDATVWSAGGNPSRGHYVPQQEIYKPAYLFNPDGSAATRPSITGAPSSISYNDSFTVQTPDAANISHVALVRNGNVTHAFGMDQRLVELSFTAGNGSVTVTAPPNGNIAPPGYYMLFLLNKSGVPSIAPFLQLMGPPTFSVSSPASVSVSQGNRGNATITTTVSGGFNSSINLSVSGVPSGTTATLNPAVIAASGAGTSTMNIVVGSSTPIGSYPLTITLRGGGIQHTATVNLVVGRAVVVTPVFSPTSGTYTSAQSVTITDATAGAAIYYTTNGTTPTTASLLYTGPIAVASTETLKAMAAESGYGSSGVATATFTIAAAVPVFSPKPTSYTSTQSVTISDSTAGAAIYYTANGTTPTTSSNLYTGPITVSSTVTIKAIAAAPGYSHSGVATALYTIAAIAPAFSPKAGTYTAAQSVSMTDATAGASIYYTTNGTKPTTSSTLYNGPIAVTTTQMVKAIAVATGYGNSSVTSAAYVIAVPTPIFSPKTGTYTSSQSVAITDSMSGVAIYYTTDGSPPTSSSKLYTGPVVVSSSQTIKAIATAPGYSNSALATAAYTISASAPALTPKAGTYNSAQIVSMTDATPGAAIYYSTDGSTPTSSSKLYAGPVVVSSSQTIKAIAVASGYGNSVVTTATYTVSAP